MGIVLNVNGREYELGIEPDMPLLWCLRDVLGLTGTKFGCGRGICGACVVHLGHKAIRSCMTPISTLAGRAITTIEGLSSRCDHPVQRAWISEKVSQCGYCQPGQIMTTVALLMENPAPTDDEIASALSMNLCRCGTYDRIKRAVERAAREISHAQ